MAFLLSLFYPYFLISISIPGGALSLISSHEFHCFLLYPSIFQKFISCFLVNCTIKMSVPLIIPGQKKEGNRDAVFLKKYNWSFLHCLYSL